MFSLDKYLAKRIKKARDAFDTHLFAALLESPLLMKVLVFILVIFRIY